MLLSLLVACNPTLPSDDTSYTEQTSSEAESNQESKDEGSKAEESEFDVKQTVTDPEHCTVVSTGCSYETSVKAGDSYPDLYNCQLTDGIYASNQALSFTDEKLVGYAPGSASVMTVVIDLGGVQEKLYHFEVDFLNSATAGIGPISRFIVNYSVDGSEYKLAGYTNVVAQSELEHRETAVFESTEYITARYIKFTISKSSSWIFLDEVTVCADIEYTGKSESYKKAISDYYKSNGIDADTHTSNLAAVKGDAVGDTSLLGLISKGCNYKVSADVIAGMEANTVKLTDGVISRYIESSAYMAYQSDEPITVTIDLGKQRTDLSVFSASLYSNPAVGNYLPLCMKVEVSADKKTFTEIGRVYASGSVTELYYDYTVSLSSAVSGRYVNFTFDMFDGSALYVEECAIYAYGVEDNAPTMYPEVVLPTVTKDIKRTNGSKQVTNLIKGLSPQIMSAADVNEETIKNNTPVTSPVLTDGNYGQGTNIHGGTFFKFNRGASRDIFFDLEYLASIESFKVGFLSYTDWAVTAPEYVNVLLSRDGITWYEICTLTFDQSTDRCIKYAECKLDTPLAARFIRFSFPVGTWAAADEFEVYGTERLTDGTIALAKSDYKTCNTKIGEYKDASDDLLGGSSDIVLLYHSKKSDNKAEDILPYMAYLDTDGNIRDTMFDGFLFLLSGAFPSGGAPHQATTMSDWQWSLDRLFAADCNIDALNKTAATVNEALGTNKKYNFYVTLYYPMLSMTAFGDVDGDGNRENCSRYADRVKVMRWYIDEFEKRFAAGNYQNLNFCGYYWMNESINTSSDSELLNLLNDVADYVHERDYDFFWIPYFQASGYSRWESFGFDTACMQPNYAFDASVLESRLDTAVDMIKKFNMCIEIELQDSALDGGIFFEKYMDYLYHGITDEYMTKSIHMYYQGFFIFKNACYSKDTKARLVYDYTYQFIKNTLQGSPEKPDDITLTATKDTVCEGSVAIAGDQIATYKLTIGTEHGSVIIGTDGSFVYYPDAGFTGTDTFTYAYSHCLGFSEPAVVTITVE